MVNESATDKLIRELKTENENLKKMLLKAAGGGKLDISSLGMGSADDIVETMDHTMQEIEEMEEDNFEKKLAE